MGRPGLTLEVDTSHYKPINLSDLTGHSAFHAYLQSCFRVDSPGYDVLERYLQSTGLQNLHEVTTIGSGGSAVVLRLAGTDRLLKVFSPTEKCAANLELSPYKGIGVLGEDFHHPNIMSDYTPVLSCPDSEDIFWDESHGSHNHVVAEWVPFVKGKTLTERTTQKREEKALGIDQEVFEVLKQMVRVLCYLKEKKILHRDIKLDNFIQRVRRGKNGKDIHRVKLIDFDLARRFKDGEEPFEAEFKGAPFYFSPERTRKEPYSYPSDAWAVGLILFQQVFGYHPRVRFPQSDPVVVTIPRVKTEWYYQDAVMQVLRGFLDSNPETRMTPEEALGALSFTG